MQGVISYLAWALEPLVHGVQCYLLYSERQLLLVDIVTVVSLLSSDSGHPGERGAGPTNELSARAAANGSSGRSRAGKGYV